MSPPVKPAAVKKDGQGAETGETGETGGTGETGETPETVSRKWTPLK